MMSDGGRPRSSPGLARSSIASGQAAAAARVREQQEAARVARTVASQPLSDALWALGIAAPPFLAEAQQEQQYLQRVPRRPQTSRPAATTARIASAISASTASMTAAAISSAATAALARGGSGAPSPTSRARSMTFTGHHASEHKEGSGLHMSAPVQRHVPNTPSAHRHSRSPPAPSILCKGGVTCMLEDTVAELRSELFRKEVICLLYTSPSPRD